MPEFRTLSETRDDRGTTTVWLDMPDRKMNVLDEALFADLDVLCQSLEAERGTRLVVFRSRKDSGFLAGADLKRIRDFTTPAEAAEFSALGQRVFDRLAHLPIPTLAVIHGPCLGGGLEFALSCRHRIARSDPRTRLGLPEVKLGLIPAWGGTQRLPRLVGVAAAARLILEGRELSAVDAAQIGLVDRAAPEESFEAAVEQFSEEIAAESPEVTRRPTARWCERTWIGRWFAVRNACPHSPDTPAQRAVLRALRAGSASPAVECVEFARLLFTPECRERLSAFFERGRAKPAAPEAG